MTEYKINGHRIKKFCKERGMRCEDLLSRIGYSSSIIDKSLTSYQYRKIKNYLDDQYPYINSSYIFGSTSQKNKYIDYDYIEPILSKKGISEFQLNRYILSELSVSDAYKKLTIGDFPRNEAECECLVTYVINIIDDNNDHTKNTEVPAVIKKGGKRPLYETDPDNYVENIIDTSKLDKAIKHLGWRKSTLHSMINPDNPTEVANIFSKSNKSISKTLIVDIEAAFQCSYNSLSTNGTDSNPDRKRYFRRSASKTYSIKYHTFSNMNKSELKIIAETSGISLEILLKYQAQGYSLYFNEAVAKNVFRGISRIYPDATFENAINHYIAEDAQDIQEEQKPVETSNNDDKSTDFSKFLNAMDGKTIDHTTPKEEIEEKIVSVSSDEASEPEQPETSNDSLDKETVDRDINILFKLIDCIDNPEYLKDVIDYTQGKLLVTRVKAKYNIGGE